MLIDEFELDVEVTFKKLSLEDTTDLSKSDRLQTLNATLESSHCGGTMPSDTDGLWT